MVHTPLFRAEHVGSLPRPDRLLTARERHARGEMPRAELAYIELECIREAVALQERVGIGAITDGEYPKTGWREFLFEKCDGFTKELNEPSFPFHLFPPAPLRAEGQARCARSRLHQGSGDRGGGYVEAPHR
jgi:methionine synthase II (cobalamin-independent)